MNIPFDLINKVLPADQIPLPSYGLVYSKDSFFSDKQHLQFNVMTPFQEDILLNNVYRKNGTAVKNLLSSCLTTPGLDISELLVGDKNALMVAVFILNYGRVYELGATCPKCEEQVKFGYDLTQIPIKRLKIKPVVSNQNIFEFILPKTKYKVLFKFPTIEDEIISETSKQNELDTNLVTKKLSQVILEINGVKTKKQITKFICNLNAYDSMHLRNYIDENEPGLDMFVDFVCSSCEYTCGLNIPTNHEFFSIRPEHREPILLEPFFLLGYYFGMDWSTYYYKFPVNYKKWLIERIQKEIKQASEANEQGGSQVPSKGAHHNTPDLRAMAGKHRAQVPSKLRRFT